MLLIFRYNAQSLPDLYSSKTYSNPNETDKISKFNPLGDTFDFPYIALSMFFDSLKYYQTFGEIKSQLKLQVFLADKLRETGNYKESLMFYNEAFRIADSMGSEQEYITIKHGKSEVFYEVFIHTDQQQYLDSTIQYANEVFKSQNVIIDSCIISENHNVLGAIQIHLGNPDSAVILLKKALSFHHIKEPPLPTLANLSYAYFLQKDYKNAFIEIEKCYKESANTNNLVFMGVCIDNLILYSKETGDSVKAKALRKQRQNLSRNNEIELQHFLVKNLFLKHQNEEKYTDILTLRNEKFYLIRVNKMLVLFLAAFILIFGFIFVLLHQSKKLRKSNQELLRNIEKANRLELEKKELAIKTKDAESKSLKAELQSKKAVLNEKLLVQADFKGFMREVNLELKTVMNQTDKESMDKHLLAISHKIETHESSDWWEDYQLLFNSVAGVFFKKLGEWHKDLTENEKRLAYLIATGLSSKEIAQILHRTYRSVEMARHRLRQKLQLDTGENIQNYLEKFLNLSSS